MAGIRRTPTKKHKIIKSLKSLRVAKVVVADVVDAVASRTADVVADGTTRVLQVQGAGVLVRVVVVAVVVGAVVRF